MKRNEYPVVTRHRVDLLRLYNRSLCSISVYAQTLLTNGLPSLCGTLC